MKKFLLLALVAFASLGLFVSCSSSDDGGSDINGKWTLSTVNGVAAATVMYNMTMTVSNGATYVVTATVWGFPANESGTVAAKSANIYTFTDSDGEATDYTLDGDKLSGTEVDKDGDSTAYVFVK
jgi:hypothetical protein